MSILNYITFLISLIYCVPGYGINIDSLKSTIEFSNAKVLKAQSTSCFAILDYYYRGNGKNLDSLLQYATWMNSLTRNKSHNIDTKTTIKYYLAVAEFQQDTAVTFRLLDECIRHYKTVGNLNGLGKCLYRKGNLYGKLGKLQKKKSYIEKAIQCLEKTTPSEDLFYIFNSYVGLCSANMELGYFTEAMNAGLRSRQIAEESKSKKRLLSSSINLSALYGNLSLEELDYSKPQDRRLYSELSMQYALEAFDLAQENSNLKYICLTSFNLGLHYSEQKEWGKSNRYLDDCISSALEGQRYFDLFSAYDIKGDNYRQMNMPDSSEYCFYQAYTAAQSSPSINIKIRAEHTIVDLLIDKGAFQKALPKALNALKLSDNLNNPRRKQAAYSKLYKIYKALGASSMALKYYEQYNSIKDSIVDQQTLKDIEILKNKFVTAQNEREISELKQQQLSQNLIFQRRILWAGVFIFLLVTLGIIYYFRNRNKILEKERTTIELEQRLLRSQMNPHFTFNALSSIQTYLLQNGQAGKGAYYLAKFAKLMRQILVQSRTAFITVKEEVQTLQNYLSLQKLRYEDGFNFEIKVEEDIDQNTTLIPPMIIQPIIENAIEHGKIYNVENGKVDVFISCEEGTLLINIHDNGVGRSTSKNSRAGQQESIALKIIEDRLVELQKKYGNKVGFKIIDPNKGGTEVLFILPLINQFN